MRNVIAFLAHALVVMSARLKNSGDEWPPGGGFPGGFPGGNPGGGFPGGAPAGFPAGFPGGNPGGTPGGFPGGFPGGIPGGKPGGFPGFPDMGNIMACGSKLEKKCCSDEELKASMCIPFYYCQVAVGEKPTGPFRCGGPGIGDPAKCDKDDATLSREIQYGLAKCRKQLEGLYDLQRTLVECAHEAAVCKTNLESESTQVERVAAEAKKCKEQHMKKGGSSKIEEQIHGGFCVSHAAAIEAAIAKLNVAEIACIEAQMPKIEIQVPKIEIIIPDVRVAGNISSPNFQVNVQVPEFNAPDFSGDIVVPGGGGNLNAPSGQGSTPISLDQRMGSVGKAIQECKATKDKCASTEERMQTSRKEVDQQKAEECKEKGGSFVQVADEINPTITTMVEVLSAQKSNPFFAQCPEVGLATDAVIAVIRTC